MSQSDAYEQGLEDGANKGAEGIARALERIADALEVQAYDTLEPMPDDAKRHTFRRILKMFEEARGAHG